MRKLSETEILSLNKLLQLETSAITKARIMVPMIEDERLKGIAETSVLSSEARIKNIQQFLNENNIIDTVEVH